jgi:hypothetical protein
MTIPTDHRIAVATARVWAASVRDGELQFALMSQSTRDTARLLCHLLDRWSGPLESPALRQLLEQNVLTLLAKLRVDGVPFAL